MSLILPIAQITARTAPDPAQRIDAPDPAAAPFAQELLQALGGTASPPVSPTGELPPATAPERLDPLGAALRALLGGETTADAVQGEEQPVEGAKPEETEPVQSEESPVAAELAAELALLVVAAPATSSSPDVSDSPGAPASPAAAESVNLPVASDPLPVDAPPVPVVVPPVEVETATPAPIVAESQGSVQTLLVAEAAAESLPKPTTDSESAPVTDRSPAAGAKVTAKGPTFDDLVQLVTETQSQDAARHAPKHSQPESQTPTEPAREATIQVQSASASDGEPEAIGPVGHRIDGPKPSFGELLPTQAAEPRPVRSTEIPAPALLNQVTRSIRLLAEGARSELQVKLHPAELGEVLVRLTIQDGLLTAHLQTTDAAVKATLDANLDALRARFEQHGLQVNSLAVSTGAGQLTDDGQAKSGWAQPSNQPTRRGSSDDAEDDEPNAPTEPNPVRRILGRRGLSRLDHLA